MTDKEIIIKALECCVADDYDESCAKCPMIKHKSCVYTLHTNVLDLINRQQAKIEKLKVGIEEEHSISQSYSDLCDFKQKEIEKLKFNLKSVLDERADHTEAIKEFADKLKEKIGDSHFQNYGLAILEIHDLVKEMVGDDK